MAAKRGTQDHRAFEEEFTRYARCAIYCTYVGN